MLSLRATWAWVAALGFLLGLPNTSFAQNTQTCAKPTVFFVNGVWNPSPRDAWSGSRALEQAIGENNGPSALKIRTLHNPGDGLLEDLAEVAITQADHGVRSCNNTYTA